LQIGAGTADNTGSNVNFAAANMKHVNGLAKIVLGTKTIPLTRTFYITNINQSSLFTATMGGTTYDSKGIAAYMQYYQGQMTSDPITSSSTYKTGTFTDAYGNTHNFVEDSGSISVKAAADCSGSNSRPFLYNNTFYYILKPSTSVIFYSAKGIKNGWGTIYTDNRITATAKKNDVSSYTAQSDSTFDFLTVAYTYVGKVEAFMAPISKKYKLEAWGAQSGGWGAASHYMGGYASGYKIFNAATKIYTCVGDVGYCCTETHPQKGTGYNGGGKGYYKNESYQGGGASDFTTTDRGELRNFVSYKDEVLLVAGGSGTGGGWDGGKQHGGGLTGGNSSAHQSDGTFVTFLTGATQSNSGSQGNPGGFGYGGDSAFDQGGGAGGAGWFGGCGANSETSEKCGGGGGSSFIEHVENGKTIEGIYQQPWLNNTTRSAGDHVNLRIGACQVSWIM